MYQRTALLALATLAISACATRQTTVAEKEVCTTEHVESTGSRVEPRVDCQPAP